MKQLIDEQLITQGKLSEEIHISQQTISKIINGKAALTEQTAIELSKRFPNYRKEWFMGIDNAKTEYEKIFEPVAECITRRGRLAKGLKQIGLCCDIRCYYDKDPTDPETVEEYINSGFAIEYKGKKINISIDAEDKLLDEICDFVEFKVKKLVENNEVE